MKPPEGYGLSQNHGSVNKSVPWGTRPPKGSGLSINHESVNKIDAKQMTTQKDKGTNKTTKSRHKTFQKKQRPWNAGGYAKQAHDNLIDETNKTKQTNKTKFPTRLLYMIHRRLFPTWRRTIRTQQTNWQVREGERRKTAWRRRTHTRITKSSENTNTRMKAHNTAQTRWKLTQLHYGHKISNIFHVHAFRRINEAFFDKKRLHDFPIGPIKISSKKWTTTWRGHRKGASNIDLWFLGFPSRSTNSHMFLPVRLSCWGRPWAGSSGRWDVSMGLLIDMQGID
jgi:hypothetical protein